MAVPPERPRLATDAARRALRTGSPVLDSRALSIPSSRSQSALRPFAFFVQPALVLFSQMCCHDFMRHGPEQLQFDPLIRILRDIFEQVPDDRDPKRIDYPLVDVLTGGLAMMFLQDPGMLPFQQRLQDQHGSSNLTSMFGIKGVPKDSQFRGLLDPIDPRGLMPGFRRLISLLQGTRTWLEFRTLDGRYLIALDGTEYFNSEKIHCPHCLKREHRDGRVEYYHQVLVAALIHPTTGESFPLCVEEIRREDGKTKQDCEINAACRLLPVLAKTYCHLDMVLLADSLYSKTPVIDLALSLKMNYIFVAQPGDHAHLQEELAGLRLSEGMVSMQKGKKGKALERSFEMAQDVPLFATTPVTGHWLGYSERLEKGKQGYRNGWVTSLKPTPTNAEALVSAGRHRSSIENQTFNALKNHGHHFEHNFGHGKINLRFNFIILNLLAFLMHRLLEIGDAHYKEAKTWKRTVREFLDHIRWAIRLALWPDWETLINSYLGRGPQLRIESG